MIIYIFLNFISRKTKKLNEINNIRKYPKIKKSKTVPKISNMILKKCHSISFAI